MDRQKFFLFVIIFCALIPTSYGQRIVYSEPGRDDYKKMNFEVIGKIHNNFLVYKSFRNSNWISVYNNEMEEVTKVDQDYLPDNDRVLNVDFFAYPDYALMIFQFRKKNIIHCVAARIDGDGKKLGELTELDTTAVGFAGESKIYTVLASEDKSKIIVFKINNRDRKLYKIGTSLFNEKLDLIKRSRMTMDMNDRSDYLDEFQLDNQGNLLFTKFQRQFNEHVEEPYFVIKKADGDDFIMLPVGIKNVMLNEIKIKPDNFNKRYFITSFYNTTRKGNTEGLYIKVLNLEREAPLFEDTLAFTAELRREAKGNAALRTAFNDYFIANIITRRDGGVLIASEATYTTSRATTSPWNRWNYMYGYPGSAMSDYYMYSPYYSGFYGSRYNNMEGTRYNADNILILSIDKNARKEWSGVITKEQFDDQNSDLISYQIMNSGGKLHFIFNNMEKRAMLLSDFTLAPGGIISKNPTLKNLDKGYDFMPRYAKQVSARQLIIPCVYRNYICFAKVEFE